MAAKVLMIQGTSSSVGKSLLVAAFCRILHQDGYRVAPFKAQNMSLNAAVTTDGLEIGRSTAVQAAAAWIEPTVDMNPILLKPEGETRSQVIVLGRVDASMAARDYYTRKAELWEVVSGALDRLRARFDAVIIEGAGSPAEVNLKSGDIVNMRVARYARAPVLLVGDIDRGGVFAALVGTLALLEPEERALVSGLLINKFRGDRRLLDPGLDFLVERTGVPLLGVIPHLPGLRIAEEDSVALDEQVDAQGAGPLTVVVVRLPHIANFDDFDLLAAEPMIQLRYAGRLEELGTPDLLILPGSKATMVDLGHLRANGMAARIIALARSGTPVLGICGGYQLLGERLRDPLGLESLITDTPGLGLLPAETTFRPQKRTVRVLARAIAGNGCFSVLADELMPGYEIHMGTTEARGPSLFAITSEGEGEAGHLDGCCTPDGLISGTYVHGLFETAAARTALITWLAARRGLQPTMMGVAPTREADYDRLAATVRAAVDMTAVYRLLRQVE